MSYSQQWLIEGMVNLRVVMIDLVLVRDEPWYLLGLLSRGPVVLQQLVLGLHQARLVLSLSFRVTLRFGGFRCFDVRHALLIDTVD